jgi:Arc/MetJ-type ribon-helix-helix transcriptional regulator
MFTLVNMKQVVISTRLPKEMANEVHDVVNGTFLNEADFFRAAIRDALLKYKISKIRMNYKQNKDAVKAVRSLRSLTSSLSEKEYEKWLHEQTKKMP